MAKNGSNSCCICSKKVWSYHNPEPVRDGTLDCCDECNRLVIKAREKFLTLPREEYAAYASQLQRMTYDELTAALAQSTAI